MLRNDGSLSFLVDSALLIYYVWGKTFVFDKHINENEYIFSSEDSTSKFVRNTSFFLLVSKIH